LNPPKKRNVLTKIRSCRGPPHVAKEKKKKEKKKITPSWGPHGDFFSMTVPPKFKETKIGRGAKAYCREKPTLDKKFRTLKGAGKWNPKQLQNAFFP